MNVNNIANPVVREKLKFVLNKYKMTFDSYLEEKTEEDYSILKKGKKWKVN